MSKSAKQLYFVYLHEIQVFTFAKFSQKPVFLFISGKTVLETLLLGVDTTNSKHTFEDETYFFGKANFL